jgi:hypothetical protein
MKHLSLTITATGNLHHAYFFGAGPLSNSYATFLIFQLSQERTVWSLESSSGRQNGRLYDNDRRTALVYI